MYHMQLLPFILLSSLTCVIYMYLYICTTEIGLHSSPYYARYNGMDKAGLYTHTCAYSTTLNRLGYIIGDTYMWYIYGMDWDVSHSPMVRWYRMDIRIHTHTHVVYGTDWDVSHSPIVRWYGMDVRIHTHTHVVYGTDWDVSHSPMVRWYGMDVRIHTHTCGIWDRLGCVPLPLSHGTMEQDGHTCKDTHVHVHVVLIWDRLECVPLSHGMI